MKPAGRPVGQADACRRCGTTRSISLAERAWFGANITPNDDSTDVEGAVVEGQRLDVGLAERDRQPLGGGAATAVLEQRRHVVGRRHVAPAAGRRQRAVAVAGGDVQHLRPRPQVDRLAQRLADDLQRRADDPEIARGPRRLLALLDGRQIRGRDRPPPVCTLVISRSLSGPGPGRSPTQLRPLT